VLQQAVRNLGEPQLTCFLAAANACAALPYAWERQLADVLISHPVPEVRAWAAARVDSRQEAPGRPAGKVVPVKVGLCEELRRRPDPTEPDLEVCLALLVSHDPLPEIDEQFARFGSSRSEFLDRLDAEMVPIWVKEPDLPLLGHAWLYRWDEHALAF